MARKPKAGARLAPAPESVWSAADPSDFLETAEQIIRCRDQRDFDSLPPIGKMLVIVYRLERTVEVEGLQQFLEYDRDLVANAIECLGAIGATKKADILKRVAMLDEDQEEQFDAGAAQWPSSGEDCAALLQTYCRAHRQEFDEMLGQRARAATPDGTDRPSDDDLRRHAYADGPAPLSGYEQFLLEPSRLPLLLGLATDTRCPSRMKAVAALYAIAGAIGSDILAGKPASTQELQAAIVGAKSLGDAGLNVWVKDIERMLESPDPESLMRWMGALFN